MNWCEQRGIEVVDSAGKAKEQQGKIEHHAQLFELMLEDVQAGVQTTDGVRVEGVPRRAAGSQEQPVVDFWCHSDATGIRSQSRNLREPPQRQPRLDREQFDDARQGRGTGGEDSENRKIEALDTRPRVVPTFQETRLQSGA